MPEGRPQDYFVKEGGEKKSMTFSEMMDARFNELMKKHNNFKPKDESEDKDTMVAKRNMAGTEQVDVDEIIERAGKEHGVDPNLIRAVIQQESKGDYQAVSHKGAGGLMQLMPATAEELGVTDRFDPEQNIMGGTKYLRQQLDSFGGDLTKALAAYNAGPGNVRKYDGIPPFPETENYVDKITSNYQGSGDYFVKD